jgi:uncharacterized membrane protein
MNTLDHNKFGESILQKIKADNIAPKPKWVFRLKDSLVWILGILSLLLGAIATSLVVYFSENESLPTYRRAGGGLIKSLLMVIPVFWLVCLLLFGVSVYYYIRHTKKGYKYSNWHIFLMISVFTVFIAAMFSVSRLNEKIEEVVSRRAPYYDTFINPNLNFWSNPEEGRLSGMVIEKISDDHYLLVNKSQEAWTVVKTIKTAEDDLQLERPVRLIGEKTGDREFIIKEVLPMGPGRGFLKRSDKQIPGCEHNKNKDCKLPPPPPEMFQE